MYKHGYVRVGTAVPTVKVADCVYNAQQIIKKLEEASKQGISVLVFPELSITGYTCADLFNQFLLLEQAEEALDTILRASSNLADIVYVVGMPIKHNDVLYNCAVICRNEKILGVVPKIFLPNYNEFYEKRWFSSGVGVSELINLCDQVVCLSPETIIDFRGVKLGVEICEDVWTPLPPSTILALAGANLIVNLSASNETVAKRDYRRQLVMQQSARLMCSYVYASAGPSESSTDLVFSGHSMITENGSMKAESADLISDDYILYADIDFEKIQNERTKCKSFADSKSYTNTSQITTYKEEFELYQSSDYSPNYNLSPTPFVPTVEATRANRCRDIITMQVAGLKKRLISINPDGFRSVIGVSGGLDSTLALLVTERAYKEIGWDTKDIIGVTMPGFGTSGRTYNNAKVLMEHLNITMLDIDITKACTQHLSDIGHDINIHDITYENTQARERTQILMDLANKYNGIVIGTGDLSELALGWCTYNGDHMSMYAVNASIPKTLVKSLVYYIAHDTKLNSQATKVLDDILDTPVSPELLPTENDEIVQVTEDCVGPYVLHDFFLYHMLRFGFRPRKIYAMAVDTFNGDFSKQTILKWMKVFYKRFFNQQFKRSCLPDGPKVGSICLSPRGDWRMPSDACSRMWLDEIEMLK